MDHKFYQSFIDLGKGKEIPDIDNKSIALLRDRGFSKFVIENEDPVNAVKMLSYVIRHSLFKPQRLLEDHNEYYIAVDLLTNTYYICYRRLMMIDIDRYKQDIEKDTLDDIIQKLSKYPKLFFRIYQSRNGYHIFVLNKHMDYKSDESIQLMHNLGCDFYYIVYSYLRGWSVRLNKKKGEEEKDDLYKWIGDVIFGQYISSDIANVSNEDTFTVSLSNDFQSKISFDKKYHEISDDLNVDTSKISLPEKNINSDLPTKDTPLIGKDSMNVSTSMFDMFLPNPDLVILSDLHIKLVDVFKNVGISEMPAPNIPNRS